MSGMLRPAQGIFFIPLVDDRPGSWSGSGKHSGCGKTDADKTQHLLPDPREICKNTVPGMGGKKPYRANSGQGESYTWEILRGSTLRIFHAP